MQSLLVEVLPIVLNGPTGVPQAVEQFQVQALIPQATVEAFIDAVYLGRRLHLVGTMRQECFVSSIPSIPSVASNWRW
jgi:hypothetical protein